MCIDTRKPSKLAVSVAAIVTMSLALPAIAQQAAPAPGTVLGADLLTEDAEAASRFYAGLFAWDVEKVEEGGYRIHHKGRLVGSISQIDVDDPEVDHSFWLVALSVNDLKQSFRSASENGARVYEKPKKVGELGSYAVIGDVENAEVLFIQPGKTPIGGTKGPGAWVWAELWTNDIDRAASFYASVVGYGHDTTDRGGQDYHLFTSQGKPRAGIVKIPEELENVEPGWAPYVGVEDIAVTLKKVKELGGRVVFGEIEHPAAGAVALIMDPAGAAVFIYQLGSAQEAK
jgi:predicted enzyme related to lactoylglutathione lyase